MRCEKNKVSRQPFLRQTVQSLLTKGASWTQKAKAARFRGRLQTLPSFARPDSRGRLSLHSFFVEQHAFGFFRVDGAVEQLVVF